MTMISAKTSADQGSVEHPLPPASWDERRKDEKTIKTVAWDP
jgi:hypothetical protein